MRAKTRIPAKDIIKANQHNIYFQKNGKLWRGKRKTVKSRGLGKGQWQNYVETKTVKQMQSPTRQLCSLIPKNLGIKEQKTKFRSNFEKG